MTVTHRTAQHTQPDEIHTVTEPGDQFQCDSCQCDLTYTIRVKCADEACTSGEGVDLCPTCFCAGKEFGAHKRGHAYRVIEFNSYPIFTEDWGADEELLLLKGIATHGFGNWKKIAEHVGTRTKEEVEKHYNQVYVDSKSWPLPRMDRTFDVDPSEFQERKRRRISALAAEPIPPPKTAPVSLPGIHEVATFLPGRLEFEHELDNEAEDLVKDLEFGVCLLHGGDSIPEDENDLDVKARVKWEEEKRNPPAPPSLPAPPPRPPVAGKAVALPVNGFGAVNGHVIGRSHSQPRGQSRNDTTPSHTQDDKDALMANGSGSQNEDDDAVEEVTYPPPIETQNSLDFKLTMIEMYSQRVETRDEAKAFMFDRGLLEYKKMQAAEKKRPREEREILHRLRPFARLQTAADYEAFSVDIVYEALLRKRIQELQQYRRLGLFTAADIEKYEADLAKRTQAKAAGVREYYNSERLQHVRGGSAVRQSSVAADRQSHDRESTPRPGTTGDVPNGVTRRPGLLNLASSPSLHLLTPAEQALCSALRILPKPYLVVKETLVREYARRGGKLRRREARDLVKIDVNKTSRVWDFLVQSGFLKINPEAPTAPLAPALAVQDSNVSSTSTAPSGTSSPVKDVIMQSPHPSSTATTPMLNGT